MDIRVCGGRISNYAKYEQKVIGNYFFTPIILENTLKTGFSLGNKLITIFVRCVINCSRSQYFMFFFNLCHNFPYLKFNKSCTQKSFSY